MLRRSKLATGTAALLIAAGVLTAGAARADGRSERPRIGLALSGGGAKGCAHIGVLRVLEELGVPIDYIAGTSMGAVIGGLYASGIAADELERVILEIDWDDLMADKPSRAVQAFRRKEDDRRYLFDFEVGLRGGKLLVPSGLRSGQRLSFVLRSLTLPVAEVRDFDALPIPFRAVATDIGQGEMVVLGAGDLVQAIRASMAIPGVFSPVVQADGTILVDGGATRNLPVDVVRAMGAEVVIAVDISSPLADPEALQSLFAISGQTIGMLTRKNMEPQLAAADLVITPPVAAYKVLQFEAAAEIIAHGASEALLQRAALERYAIGRRQAAALRASRRRPQGAAAPVVDFLRVTGNERVDDRVIAHLLEVELGTALDLDRLAGNLDRVYGLGAFELVSFELVDEGGETGLVIRGREKPWGPTYLRFGLQLESDLDGTGSFGALVNLTRTQLNARGAEWRTDFVVGRDRRLYSELYQPLDFRGGWFVAPSLDFRDTQRSFFEDGRELADLDVRRTTVAVDLGYQFGRFGEARIGLERGRASARVATGTLPGSIAAAELDDIELGALTLRATLDRLDNASIPKEGVYATFRGTFSIDALGAEDEYTKLEVSASGFHTVGRHTAFASLRAGWTPGADPPIYDPLTLGGLLSFSGFEPDELRGQELGLARLGYFYEIARLPSTFGGAVVLGGWLEAGNTWDVGTSADLGDLIYTSTVALGADTTFGPVYLAAGFAEDGSKELYFTLGKLF